MRIKLPDEPGISREYISGTQSEAPLPVRPHFLLISTAVIHGPSGFAAHRHPDYEVLFVESGRYECRIGDRRVRLDANDVLVVKPGDVHEEELLPPLRYGVVHFALKGDGKDSIDMFAAGTTPEQRRLPGVADRLRPTIDRLIHEATATDGFAMVLQEALITTFVVDLLRLIPPALLRKEFRPGDRLGGFGQKLTRMFSEHADERLDLAAMAAHLGITSRSLMHQCRKELATSPAHAFVAFKVARALILLRETTMPIHEISDLLGFDNQFHFSKVFKRVHGSAPSAVRR
jgi:AraC-like DNA-binding protein